MVYKIFKRFITTNTKSFKIPEFCLHENNKVLSKLSDYDDLTPIYRKGAQVARSQRKPLSPRLCVVAASR